METPSSYLTSRLHPRRRRRFAATLVLSVLFTVSGSAPAAAAGEDNNADERRNGEAADFHLVGQFDSSAAAQAALERSVAEGNDARVRAIPRRSTLYSVRLSGYFDLDAMSAVQGRLSDAHVESQRLGVNGPAPYALSVGLFSHQAYARGLRRKLEAMGYDNLEIVPISRTRTVYIVESRPAPAEPAAAAAMPVPPPLPEADAAEDTPVSADEADDAPMLVAGPPRRPAPQPRNGEPGGVQFGAGMDQLRVETGWLTHSGPVTGSHYARAMGHLQLNIGRPWELRLGGRIDGYYQQGDPSVHKAELDYAPSYVRYDGVSTIVTVGAQDVMWARTDEYPPSDQLSVKDVSRFVLYPLAWRRRAVPALRLEQYVGSLKADVLWEPLFRRAKLAPRDSIWYPVDQVQGRIISIQDTPVLRALIQQGKFTRQATGAGGAGVRLSATAASVDYAVTIQRAPQSLPYYRFDPTVRALLLSGYDVASAVAATPQTFTEVHPWSWFIGPDAAIDAFSATWRVEAAYISNVPVTTADYRYTTQPGVDWAAEVEFFPGDSDTRVDLQLSGQELFNPPPVLDHINIYSIGGELETPFQHDRWKARLRFLWGLDRRNIYVNPELAYTAWEPYEIYLDYHYFAGAQGTAGGFHQQHDLVTLGWRAKY